MCSLPAIWSTTSSMGQTNCESAAIFVAIANRAEAEASLSQSVYWNLIASCTCGIYIQL